MTAFLINNIYLFIYLQIKVFRPLPIFNYFFKYMSYPSHIYTKYKQVVSNPRKFLSFDNSSFCHQNLRGIEVINMS